MLQRVPLRLAATRKRTGAESVLTCEPFLSVPVIVPAALSELPCA